MKNNWQLAVVDYDHMNLKDCLHLKTTIQKLKTTSVVSHGEIVYIASMFIKSLSELGSAFSELKQQPLYAKFRVHFAYIYVPKEHCYAIILNECLRPILNEKDAIEVETQMGISLEDYL